MNRSLAASGAGLTALLLASMPATAQSPPPACVPDKVVTLDMLTEADGRVAIPVKIQDTNYRLLLSTSTVLNNLIVRAITFSKLPVRHADPEGLGRLRVEDYITGDIEIGSLQRKNVDFWSESGGDLGWDGSLATQSLSPYDIEFDFAHEKFSLLQSNRCPDGVYWSNGPFAKLPISVSYEGGVSVQREISVPVSLDGHEMPASLDTSVPMSYISLKQAEQFLGIKANDPALKPIGKRSIYGTYGDAYFYPFKEIKFGDVSLANPVIEILDKWDRNEGGLALGAALLRQLHLYIAPIEFQLYVTPATAGMTSKN